MSKTRSKPPFSLRACPRWQAVAIVFGVLAWTAAARAAPEWRVLVMPCFTVVSQLKEKDTREWADEFNQFIDELRPLLPINQDLLPQLTVVLFSGQRRFRPYLPIRPDGKTQTVAGYFSRFETWGVIGLPSRSSDEETRRVIFHEGVHWALSAAPRRYPLWLDEGFAEVFSTFYMEDNTVRWGLPILAHMRLLTHAKLMPVRDLLATKHTSRLFNERVRTGLFYAQSWALVHMLLFGSGNPAQLDVSRYLSGEHGELRSIESLARALNREPGAVDQALESYVRANRYFIAKAPALPREAKEAPFVLAQPEVVEIALARLALGGRRLAKAHEHAAAALRIAPQSPAPHDLVATLYAEEDNYDALLAECQTAIQLGSEDPWTFVLLAIEKTRRARLNGRIAGAPAREVADLYAKAIELRPNLLPAYRGLVSIVAALQNVTGREEELLRQGQRRFPRENVLEVGQAALAWKRGEAAVAREKLRRLLAEPAALEPGEQAFARQLEQLWNAEEAARHVNALTHAGRPEDARRFIDTFLAENPEVPGKEEFAGKRQLIDAYAMLQDALRAEESGRSDQAARNYERVLNTPDLPPSLEAAARQGLARVMPEESPEQQRRADRRRASQE